MKYYFSHQGQKQPTTFEQAQKALGPARHGRHRITHTDGTTTVVGGDNLSQLVGVARQYFEPAESYVDCEGPTVSFYENEQ